MTGVLEHGTSERVGKRSLFVSARIAGWNPAGLRTQPDAQGMSARKRSLGQPTLPNLSRAEAVGSDEWQQALDPIRATHPARHGVKSIQTRVGAVGLPSVKSQPAATTHPRHPDNAQRAGRKTGPFLCLLVAHRGFEPSPPKLARFRGFLGRSMNRGHEMVTASAAQTRRQPKAAPVRLLGV